MDTKETPIIPVRQVLIPLAGYQFLVVRLPGGDIAIVLSYLCKALGVDRWGQVQRIQEHPLLAEYLVTVQIKTTKGERSVNALVVWALSGWLSGFQLTRLSEEQRTLILALQREAFNTFVRPFFPETQRQPQPSALPKEEPPHSAPPKQEPQAAPLPQAEQAASSVPALLRALAGHIEQEQRAQADEKARRDRQYHEVLAWRAEMEHRWRELQAEVMALRTARKDSPPAADAPLSDEHEETLRVLLYCAGSIVGQPMEQVEREMLAAAGVKKLGEIREADWFEMVVWLTQRLG